MQVVLPAVAHGRVCACAAGLALLETIEQSACMSVKLWAVVYMTTVRNTVCRHIFSDRGQAVCALRHFTLAHASLRTRVAG